MLSFLRKVLKETESLATESYYSRSQFQLGNKLVEFRWVPVDAPGGSRGGRKSEHKHAEDLVARHKAGPMTWRLEMRGFTNPKDTPVQDGREGWSGPFVTVGTLVIPQDAGASAAKNDAALGAVEDIGYSIGRRWSSDDGAMKGRGVLNEFREAVYQASQQGRGVDGIKGARCPMGFA
jgi:hypothetical protein